MLELAKKPFENFKKWDYMALPMQREFSAYFGVQKVMGLQLFSVNSEPNMEGQLHCTLAFVDGITITSPRVTTHTSAQKDVHRSAMKRNHYKYGIK